MKIALVGDFSSLHLNLQKGLNELGYDCTLFSSGDGFKRIPGDIHFGSRGCEIYHRLYWLLFQPKVLRNLFEYYDLVQLINPYTIYVPGRYIGGVYSELVLRLIDSIKVKTRAKLGLSVAGCHALTIGEMSNLAHSPCHGCQKDFKVDRCIFHKKQNFYYERRLLGLCDAVIPFGGCAYQRSVKSDVVLPMPVCLDYFPYSENVVSDKIKILHGISRPGFKGSNLIVEALTKIGREFSCVEIMVVERLPFDEYIKVVKESNLVVDQLFGDGLGMNALISMAMGRVVLTRFDVGCIEKIYGCLSPAIDVFSAESVYQSLRYILMNWCEADYKACGRSSREFVEAHCNPKDIAQKFVSFVGL